MPEPPADVRSVLATYPAPIRERLMSLRELIFETAEAEGVGEITETLKWGEPAFLTAASRTGTTVRLGWKPSHPRRYSLLVHCQTDLVERFRPIAPEGVEFDGNRGIVFHEAHEVPRDFVATFVAAALTYHRRS